MHEYPIPRSVLVNSTPTSSLPSPRTRLIVKPEPSRVQYQCSMNTCTRPVGAAGGRRERVRGGAVDVSGYAEVENTGRTMIIVGRRFPQARGTRKGRKMLYCTIALWARVAWRQIAN
jgi:hypothetical protein